MPSFQQTLEDAHSIASCCQVLLLTLQTDRWCESTPHSCGTPRLSLAALLIRRHCLFSQRARSRSQARFLSLRIPSTELGTRNLGTEEQLHWMIHIQLNWLTAPKSQGDTLCDANRPWFICNVNFIFISATHVGTIGELSGQRWCLGQVTKRSWLHWGFSAQKLNLLL